MDEGAGQRRHLWHEIAMNDDLDHILRHVETWPNEAEYVHLMEGSTPLVKLLQARDLTNHEHLLKQLIQASPGALMKPTERGGRLPLQVACDCQTSADIIRMVLFGFPQAMLPSQFQHSDPFEALCLAHRRRSEYREGDEQQFRRSVDVFLRAIEIFSQDGVTERPLILHPIACMGYTCPPDVVETLVLRFPQDLTTLNDDNERPLDIARQISRTMIAGSEQTRVFERATPQEEVDDLAQGFEHITMADDM